MRLSLIQAVLIGLARTKLTLADTEAHEENTFVEEISEDSTINVASSGIDIVPDNLNNASEELFVDAASTIEQNDLQADHNGEFQTPDTIDLLYYEKDNAKYPNIEQLNIKPLDGNNLLMSFDFEVNGTSKLYPEAGDITYYNVFPKALGSIMKSTNVRELHVRFAQGWYDSEVYGKLVNNGFSTGGTGVELWADIEADTKEEAFENWIKLANSLSGMFCASFNFIDSSITTVPEKLFSSEIDLESQVNLRGKIFHFRSALPREPICTENLTPFLRLLPTKGKQGISTLLSGSKMFNADWSSMSVDVLTSCGNGNTDECQLTMQQSINMIVNIPKILEKNQMPIPKPTPGSQIRCDDSKVMDAYNCFPLPPSKKLNFSFTDIFGKSIEGGSLISSDLSSVCLDIDLENWEIELITRATANQHFNDSKICFGLDTNADYNIRFNTKDASKVTYTSPPPFYASRSLSGYSQDSGGFRLDVHNPDNKPQKIVIFETLPWFVRLYLHTIALSVTTEEGNTVIYKAHDPSLSTYVKEIVYNPATDRIAPTHLELLVEVPAHTKLKLSFKFDKSMLLYSEYPPDANHGFELQPTIFALVDYEDDKVVEYIMRTTTSLLTLPTPDFSMPYNVIILTLTIMSLTFGSIFNLLVKKTVTEEEAEKLQKERLLDKIKGKIRSLLGK
jgi:phosphatidylinositol glycan class T